MSTSTSSTSQAAGVAEPRPAAHARLRRIALTLVLALAAALVVAAPGLAAFPKPRSCGAGEGIFRDGRVRLFTVEGTVDGEQAWRFYVCSARIRTPRRFNETSPGTDETLSTFRRSGRRVAFLDTLVGGESFDQVLGWVDLRTGRARFAPLAAADDGPLVRAVVADARGGLAYLQDDEERGQRVGYARLGPRGTLGVPRIRAVVATGDVRPRSLAVRDGVITWSTRSGATGSVPTGAASSLHARAARLMRLGVPPCTSGCSVRG